MKLYPSIFFASVFLALTTLASALEPIPDKLVVLTFDDSVKSHHSVVRPILKKYGFGATFFITEGFDFPTNKKDYLTWEEIAELHADGFEIGNHTRDHFSANDNNVDKLAEQLTAITERCKEHKIPAPVTFSWPGNGLTPKAFEILHQQGILFARRGGAPEYDYKEGFGFAYQPGIDHPLLIPSAGDARPDWTLENFRAAVQQARGGKIAVMQFHGVPDLAHPWVNTPAEQFEAYMKFLSLEGYQVLALRDLAKYVDPQVSPAEPLAIIATRKKQLEAEKVVDEEAQKKVSDLRVGKLKVGKILVPGNSVTNHGPALNIGWTGNWGMAASAREKDFVHQLQSMIAKEAGGRPQMIAKNMADFERQLSAYDLKEGLKKEWKQQPDMVIVAIGANAAALTTPAGKDQFRLAFTNLLAEIRSHEEPKLFVRSEFWFDGEKEKIMREACEAARGTYVDMKNPSSVEANAAHFERKFEHAGVGGHPGDKGMQVIAEALWQAIQEQAK